MDRARSHFLFDDDVSALRGFAQVPPPMTTEWGQLQRKLSSRWQALHLDDFKASNGDRLRFIDRLAYRLALSRSEAAEQLAAFESEEPTQWPARSAVDHYEDQVVAKTEVRPENNAPTGAAQS